MIIQLKVLNKMLSKFSIIVLLSLSFGLYVDSLDVKTSSGTVRGQTIEVLNQSVNQFLNIPYAEPPVGKLRFSKPVPLKQPINGIIDGTKVGNSCFQNMAQLGGLVKNSEDCLVLNVLSPELKNSSDLKPVMFWIYGGAFTTGSIFYSFYDGKVLATHDIVFVAANYRLGPFGFLYGGDESAPGNIGLYDQLLALKWVKQNIHLFGGDPNQITIFGESAGSFSVSTHVVSPLSRGLFKRAILQSGAVLGNKNTPSLTKPLALSQAKLMAKHFNCSDDNQWLDCLRRVDAKELNNYHELRAYVIHGTDFMPITAQIAFKTQNYSKDVDIMAGVMRNEGSMLAHLFLPKSEQLKSAKEFLDFISSLGYPELNLQRITEFYLGDIDTNSTEDLKKAFYDFFGDFAMKCPTYFFAKQFSDNTPKRNTPNVFFYEWTYPSHLLAPLLGCTKEMGVCHGSDIEYVFGLNVLSNTSDKKFSEDVMKMWTDFAKNGQPLDDFPSGSYWPRMTGVWSMGGLTKVKEMNPSKPNHIIENPFRKECDQFWNSYFN